MTIKIEKQLTKAEQIDIFVMYLRQFEERFNLVGCTKVAQYSASIDVLFTCKNEYTDTSLSIIVRKDGKFIDSLAAALRLLRQTMELCETQVQVSA